MMVISSVLSRAMSHAAQRAHFLAILEAAVDLVAVIYNGPYCVFWTKAAPFFDLHRAHTNLIGFKNFWDA